MNSEDQTESTGRSFKPNKPLNWISTLLFEWFTHKIDAYHLLSMFVPRIFISIETYG